MSTRVRNRTFVHIPYRIRRSDNFVCVGCTKQRKTYLGDGPGFVIPANKLDTVRPPQLETREERYRLYTEETSIDVIT